MTVVQPLTSRSELDRGIEIARQALARGEAIAFPVEHGYVVAVEPFSESGVQRVQEARGASGSALPLLIGSQQTLDGVAKPLPLEVRTMMIGLWPGLLTLYVPSSVPWDLGDGGAGMIALRQPNDPVALALLRHGPLAATTAAPTGATALSAQDVLAGLGDAVAVILDDGPRSAGPASTILSLTGSTLSILREGAISREEIESHAGGLTVES
jgi:L-threonylcarbamoyladenylate synthase